MGDIEKKARLSGEQTRIAEPATILPTTNVPLPSEKPAPPQPSLHPAVYVVYVDLDLFWLRRQLTCVTGHGLVSAEV